MARPRTIKFYIKLYKETGNIEEIPKEFRDEVKNIVGDKIKKPRVKKVENRKKALKPTDKRFGVRQSTIDKYIEIAKTGDLFGVKPILISDAKGNNYAYEKQKGRRNALIRSAELVKEWVIDPEEQTLWISDAECKKEDMDLLVNSIKAAVPFKNVVVVPMGPVIGASAGKGTIGIYFMGKKVEFVGA